MILLHIKKFIKKYYCGVEQRPARVAHNHKVEGSNPSPATKHKAMVYEVFGYPYAYEENQDLG